MPLLDRDGVALHYDVTGAGDRTVVLSHGWAASSRMFASNVPVLAEHHTVVTWDLRGHGRSDAPVDPAAYSAPLAVADMVALLDVVGAERAVVAGHSLGGYLSLRLQHDHPARVEALVLIDTGPGFRQPEGRAGWNALAERFAARLEARGLDGLGDSVEVDRNEHRDTGGLILSARGILTQHDGLVLDGLPAIGVPTLVVVGGDDEAFLGGSRYMAAQIPGARLVEIPGAGHAPNVTHNELFDAPVLDFLDTLP